MIQRRFVNMVGESCNPGLYSLHRLDVAKHLFYPSRSQAQLVPPLVPGATPPPGSPSGGGTGDEKPMQITRMPLEMLRDLPPPCVKIRSPPSSDRRSCNKLPFFGLLNPRSSEDKVLCLDWAGNALLCDADEGNKTKEDLYVFHNAPRRGDTRSSSSSSCFCVLTRSSSATMDDWQWEPLPSPPYVHISPQYKSLMFISSHTVVDRTICVSSGTQGIGTYCFDTAKREWRRAGGWALPFHGRAEYVPDLDLWLGFSHCINSYLCATSDLKDAIMEEQQPTVEHVWQDMVRPPNWTVTSTDLVNLGSGRFCIAKEFEVMPSRARPGRGDWHLAYEVFVFTGVEIVRSGGDDEEAAGRRLEVLKHKSVAYLPMKYDIRWVL
ncbi:hypothetical protein QOZ80_7BG0583810 [Eleusine coracana subsp. coracana]|nr:hypothetical protein QOZ80_7BG0583810 [Eleusine coracana subsp. coracana]